MATSNYEGFIFRLSGVTTSSGSTIPTGTTLEKVILTTRDLLTPAGTAGGGIQDAFGLISGESATFQIDGVVISNTAPVFRAALLNTDAGSIAVLIFTVGSNSYALARPGTDFDAPSQIVAASVTNTNTVGIVNPLTYGLLPEGANTYSAQTFNAQFFGGTVTGVPDYSAIGSTTIYDTDLNRGNGELVPTTYVELLATIQFTDGTIIGGVETLRSGGYSGYVTSFSYLFDQTKLAESGHTLADVRGVLGSFEFDHNLNWDDAGFTLSAGPAPDGGGNDVPPPPPVTPRNIINGTSRADTLNGTAAADAIRGFDGNDRLTGNGGADVFIFGTDSRSGKRSTDTITDYQVGQDFIGLEAGSSIRNIVDNGSAIVITLVGDGDRIVINGAALNVSDIRIADHPISFDLI